MNLMLDANSEKAWDKLTWRQDGMGKIADLCSLKISNSRKSLKWRHNKYIDTDMRWTQMRYIDTDEREDRW